MRSSYHAKRRRRPRADAPLGDVYARADRRAARAERMGELGVDVLLLSTGADLPYFTGYEAMPLERLTMLVLRWTATPCSSFPGSRRRGSSSSPTHSTCSRGTRPTTRSRIVAGLVGGIDRRRVGGDRRSHVGAVRARSPARAARRRVPSRGRRHRPDARGEGRGRDRGAASGGARGRRHRRDDARQAVRRSDRARRAPRAGRAHARSAATSAPTSRSSPRDQRGAARTTIRAIA